MVHLAYPTAQAPGDQKKVSKGDIEIAPGISPSLVPKSLHHPDPGVDRPRRHTEITERKQGQHGPMGKGDFFALAGKKESPSRGDRVVGSKVHPALQLNLSTITRRKNVLFSS